MRLRHLWLSRKLATIVQKFDLSGTTVKGMTSKYTMPKKKEEYVAAISVRTGLAREELRCHDCERLKQIWTMVKPRKPQSPLPVGWKKLDVAALKELYEDLNRPDDNHWVRWRCPTLVTEIDMWLADVMADMPEEDLCHETLLCGVCKIPMVRRTNRLTKTDFYGCVRFPLCAQTLPLTYGGQPTKEVQDALKEEEEAHRWQPTKGKNRGYPKFEKEKKIEKDNPVRRKAATAVADGRGSSSDGSWVRAGTIPIQESSDENEEKDPVKPLYNTNVTEEELAILKEMRLAKKNEEK